MTNKTFYKNDKFFNKILKNHRSDFINLKTYFCIMKNYVSKLLLSLIVNL